MASVDHIAATIISVALLAATLSPLVRDPVDDGFPLSTYPMFAVPRPTTLTLNYALGETATGERRTLSPTLVGTGEVLQAGALIDHAIHRGRHELDALCERIAVHVAADDAFADVVTIRIVTGTHDAVEYLVRHVVGRESDHARCAVPRGAP